MSRLGETIRSARIQAKMTEKALAKKCGMAEGVIKDIESGRRIVSDGQAQRILKILGVENPVSAELEVAQEPEVPLRPRPRPYKLPVSEPETRQEGDGAAWLDALGGVVKRVPVTDEDSTVIDHVLVPIVGGKIEGILLPLPGRRPARLPHPRWRPAFVRAYAEGRGRGHFPVPPKWQAGRAQGQQDGRKPHPFAELRPRVCLADASRRRSSRAGAVRKTGTEAVTCGFTAICTSTPACRPAATS